MSSEVPDTLFGIPAEVMGVNPPPVDIPIPTEVAPAEAPVQMTADEEAAMKFTKLLPYVTKLSDAMPSKGGLVRVLTALGEFPLGGRQPRLLNESERQLFAVMQELQGYKSTVIASFIKKQADIDKMRQDASQAPVHTESSQNESDVVSKE